VETMTPDQIVEAFSREKASAILRTPHGDRAMPAMRAAIAAGFRICEFTLTIPSALELINELSREEGLIVGAGTVLTVDDARRAVDAGACFLVSPVVDETVIEEAGRLGVASMPGAYTPTEMLRAHNCGASLVKLFPMPADGLAYLKAVRGPLPFLPIVPTSGVDATNVAEFLAIGAHAVGFVAPLFDPALIDQEDYGALEERGKMLRRAAGCET